MTDVQSAEAEPRSKQRRALTQAFVSGLFLILLTVLGIIAAHVLESRVEQRRDVAHREAAEHLETLGVRLNETMGAAYLMAGAVIQDQGRNPKGLIDSVAPQLLQQFPLAAAIQLAPKGVILYSYPLKDNREAIGHDLLVDPKRNQEAHLAVSTGKLTLAGPFKLVQGGIGAVARFPVYINNIDGWPKFWGFTTVLVRVPRMIEAAGLTDLQRSGYRFSLCRVRDQNGCEVFAAQGDSLPDDPVKLTLAVPNGQWILAVSPKDGWWQPMEIGAVALLCLALAGALTGVIVFFSRLAYRTSDLVDAGSAP